MWRMGGGGGGGLGVGGLGSCVEGLGAAEVSLWEAVGGRRGWDQVCDTGR
jgi:hypothetical protein